MSKTSKQGAWYAIVVLFLINTLNFFDRLIIGALGEPIRKEFELGDASLGLLATAFTLVYAVAGLPLGRLADRVSRPGILAGGVLVWSLFTAASGLARSYWQIFAFRIGVGIGEASCAPAATSLISDLFPQDKRARAMSIFMLGLPIGIALSFAVSGTLAQAYGWRMAFIAAGVPGIILAALALLIREPRRDVSQDAPPRSPDAGSPYRSILSSPTMRWLIVSGAIHNFCLYALSSFMTPYLMRFHGLEIRDASLIAMFVNGIFTLPGLLLGGVVGDAASKRRANGGLIIVGAATLLAIPLFVSAVLAEAGNTTLFLWAMGGAFALMYFYYSVTYSAIAEVTEPGLRGTAMSVYFLAMYVLGGALGPYVLGLLSDQFTRRAAVASGVTDFTTATLEPFRAAGLQTAMYIVPILCIALAGIMFMAARAMKKEAIVFTGVEK
ncbi:MAG TPA: MFS transporter [Pyrinomonadaceae bacterium]|nr:MFS transporter [Pyrinomonadaceae bacterium]